MDTSLEQREGRGLHTRPWAVEDFRGCIVVGEAAGQGRGHLTLAFQLQEKSGLVKERLKQF
jgi:hypothetical protein